MPTSPNHLTVVVRDVEKAKAFFTLLGLDEGERKIISGKVMENYMGVPGIEAEHVTLVLTGHKPYFDIQLLRYRNPMPTPDEHAGDLTTLGYNHFCFAVDDLDATLARLTAAGVVQRNSGMEFRDYKMAFVWGPEKITVELVQRIK